MKFGISEVAFIPIRQGLSDRSEMLSQVLFGECFQILTQRGDWMRIKNLYDNYEGWVSTESVTIIDQEQLNEYNNNSKLYSNNLQTDLLKNSNSKVQIPAGATLPGFNYEDNSFVINNNKYVLQDSILNDSENENKREVITDVAKKLLNAPYLWGGRTPWGIDCSGFTQYAYRVAGIIIPRDSSEQVNLGNTINFISDAKKGDLVFFDNEEGNIVHVGIYLENGKIIHASKKVRIDIIDHQGIYNRDIKRYSHDLRVIKSIINT